jgi:hypothetical protein
MDRRFDEHNAEVLEIFVRRKRDSTRACLIYIAAVAAVDSTGRA